MENLKKVTPLSKILTILCFLGLLISAFLWGKIFESNRDQEIVILPENTINVEQSEKLTTYTSKKLGVSFQYPEKFSDAIIVNESENKISLSEKNDSVIAFGDFEVIKKDPNEPIEDSIAKIEKSIKPNSFCFLTETNRFAKPITEYRISYPYENSLTQHGDARVSSIALSYKAKVQLCNSSYSYLYNEDVPTHFVKKYSRVGAQDPDYMPVVNDMEWIYTLQIIPQE